MTVCALAGDFIMLKEIFDVLRPYKGSPISCNSLRRAIGVLAQHWQCTVLLQFFLERVPCSEALVVPWPVFFQAQNLGRVLAW